MMSNDNDNEINDETIRKIAEEVRDLAEEVAGGRAQARYIAIAACRTIEAALVGALRGEPLRGVKNLGNSTHPCYGMRVRGGPDAKIPLMDGFKCFEYLILTARGNLSWVRFDTHGTHGFEFRSVQDEELRAEDVRELVANLAIVLPRHFAASSAASAKYRDLADLAHILLDALAQPPTRSVEEAGITIVKSGAA